MNEADLFRAYRNLGPDPGPYDPGPDDPGPQVPIRARAPLGANLCLDCGVVAIPVSRTLCRYCERSRRLARP